MAGIDVWEDLLQAPGFEPQTVKLAASRYIDYAFSTPLLRDKQLRNNAHI
jgi:hypothetical protein